MAQDRFFTLRRFRNARLAGAVAAFAAFATAAPADVILQFYEARWETIEHRMADIFMAGYDALWVPPPSQASGGFSVGYDVFDRFEMGNENLETLYGTEADWTAFMEQATRAGVLVYPDAVYNHNGYADCWEGSQSGQCDCTWAHTTGGYPGFLLDNNEDVSDFKNSCGFAPSCDADPVNCRISNLIDIDLYDFDNQYIRHPIDPSDSRNIPHQGTDPENRRFYPDQDLPGYDDGVRPFNLQDPYAGDPTVENATNLLQRWTQWMLEVHRTDGFRLDAVKHIEAHWLSTYYDFAAHNRARDWWGRPVTAFSFGELVSNDMGYLLAYHRKDGYGNRTVLDFPLHDAMRNHIGNPSGNFAEILDHTFDVADDGLAQNGSAGVIFVQSHDNGIGDPPPIDNVAYAHALTRRGYPTVYMNAMSFWNDLGNPDTEPSYPRDFPNRNSRQDALGGLYGTTMLNLMRVHDNFVADRASDYRSLWRDTDFIGYELNNTLVVGLTDRNDQGGNGRGWEERFVENFGFRNVTLVEVTGNAADPLVDPLNEIPDQITIPGSGGITLRVPTAQNINGGYHGRPYVMYSIRPPAGTFSLLNPSGTLATDPVPNRKTVGLRRLAPIEVVSGAAAQLQLQIDQGAGTLEDNALIRWNYGLNVDGNNDGELGIALGINDPLLAGFENFTTVRSTSASGGTGTYRLDVNLANPAIPEGFNYITVVAFVPRAQGLPPIHNTFRKVLYVDRRGPDVRVVFPQNPDGDADILQDNYGFVVENPDGTANSLHYFWNLPQGTDPVAQGMVNGGNQAARTDRSRWRFNLGNLADGDNQRLTLALFEQTGTYAVHEVLVGVELGGPEAGFHGVTVR